MKIDKVTIKTNSIFTDSMECTVEMSDDLGICYAYSMGASNHTPHRALVEACVRAILVRYTGVITNRYYERTGQC